MDEPEGYSVIDVGRVMRMARSGKAYLMEVEGDAEWVPVSVLRDPDAVRIGRTNVELEVATWFAKKNGWGVS